MTDGDIKRAMRDAVAKAARERGLTVEEFERQIERLAVADEVLFETTGLRYWQTRYAASHGQAAQSGRMQGGEVTAKERKQEAEETRRNIVELWHSLNTMPERNRASVIAERVGLTARQVREHLKKAEVR
ncbi:hypothetical protein [Thioalkalivibrio sp. AKL19]|uniref:hypothetical protein n=1 Tax=Thioalkalivibrio sp. AKL19 TaxID=1266914 RepID=UPI0004625565|nr:hypothetical protein [Thioalkalivibrio sp. AKL19]